MKTFRIGLGITILALFLGGFLFLTVTKIYNDAKDIPLNSWLIGAGVISVLGILFFAVIKLLAWCFKPL